MTRSHASTAAEVSLAPSPTAPRGQPGQMGWRCVWHTIRPAARINTPGPPLAAICAQIDLRRPDERHHDAEESLMCHRIAEYEVLTERLVHFERPEVTSSNARSGSASWRGRCHLPICYFYARPGTVCSCVRKTCVTGRRVQVTVPGHEVPGQRPDELL